MNRPVYVLIGILLGVLALLGAVVVGVGCGPPEAQQGGAGASGEPAEGSESPELGECPPPGDGPGSVSVLMVGNSNSDHGLLESFRSQLIASPLIPGFIERKTLVLVLAVDNSGMTDPDQLIGSVNFDYDDTGNPDLGRILQTNCTNELLELFDQIRDRAPEGGSDLIGGVRLAMTLFQQYADVPHHLLVLSDGYQKSYQSQECDFYHADFSTEASTAAVLDVCLDGQPIQVVDDLSVTQAGVGLLSNGTPDPERGDTLVRAWQTLWAASGLAPEDYTVSPILA